MIKYNILSLAILLLTIPTPGKSQSYNLTVTNEPYIPLDNGIYLNKNAWSDPEFIVPIGFHFQFYDQIVDSLYSLDFFAGGFVSTNSNLSSMDLILPFSTDIIDRGYELDSSLSPILYKITGPIGQRIFTLEFRNAGFNSGEINNGIYTDFINVQLKIYEENNNISVHIGPYLTENPGLDFEGFSGPSIGFARGFDYLHDEILGPFFILAGDPLDPTILTDFSNPMNLVWPIPENTLYTFSLHPSGVKVENPNLVNFFYPNPTSGQIFLSTSYGNDIILPVRVFNSYGELVKTDYIPEDVDLGDLPAGFYGITMQSSNRSLIQKISLIK